MSFLAPKTDLPGDLTSNTPGRSSSGSPTEVLPWMRGRGRCVVRWVTPVLHWHFRNTSTSSFAFFSCYGWIAHGPADEIAAIVVNGKGYDGVAAFRDANPGDYYDHVLAKETPERFRFFWGIPGAANYTAYLQSLVRDAAHPMKTAVHPNYKNIFALAVQDMEAGRADGGRTPPIPQVEIVFHKRPEKTFVQGYAPHGGSALGIAHDLLTSQRGGGRLPASVLNGAQWDAKIAQLHDTGIAGKAGTDTWISVVLDQARPLGEHLADILAHVDGHTRERNGKLEIDYLPSDGTTADPTGLREISKHQRAGDLELDPAGLDQLKTKVVVTGLDWNTEPPLSEASEDAQVPYAVKVLNGEQRPPDTLSRNGFTTRAQLKSYAELRAAMLANPELRATVPVLRQYATQPDNITPLRPGDRFNLDDDEKGLDLVVRILERQEEGGRVIFKVVGERGAFPQPYQPALDPRADLTLPPPADLARYTVAQLPPDLSDAADTLCTALIERPSNSAHAFEIHHSPDNVWPGQVIAIAQTRFAVCAVLQTVMASELADAVATVDNVGNDWSYLRSQSVLEQNDDQLLVWHAGEWMSLGTITPLGGGSYTLALKRARLASLPAAHAIGDVLFLILRNDLVALSHAEFANIEVAGVYDAGVATKWFKARSTGAGGLQGNLTAAFSMTMRDPTPDQPQTLVAIPGTGKMVALDWEPVFGALVNEYQIERATGPGFADWALIAETGENSYWDVEVALDTTYRYRVRAMSTDEVPSPWSNTADATTVTAVGPPGADAKLVVLTSDSQTFQIAKSGAVTPASILLTATGQHLAGAPAFSVVAGVATLTGAGNTRTLTFANLTSDSCTVKVVWDGQEDYISIVKVREGDDSITSFVTNEAHLVPANLSGVVQSLDGAVSTMKVWRGAIDDTAAWAISRVDSGCTSTLVGATATVTAMAADAAYVEFTATRAGYTNQVKRFSLSKSRVGIDTTAPAAPGAITLTGSGTYLGGDGTAVAYLDLNIPALPAGAVIQHVKVTVSGGGQEWETRGTFPNLVQRSFRLDDLTPGVSYGVGLVALGPDAKESAFTAATGSPFTAPGRTVLPGEPTGIIAESPLSVALPPRYNNGQQWFVCRIRWTKPADKSVVGYEIGWTFVQGSQPASVHDTTTDLERPFYSNTLVGTWASVRSYDRTGNRSAWVECATNLNTVLKAAAGSISAQNADAVKISAVKTGDLLASSVRNVRARYVESVVLTLAGGSTLEDFAIDISNRGFSTKPDSGVVQVSGSSVGDERLNDAIYVFDHGSNSSSTAYVSVFRKDGGNLVAGSVRLSIEFIEYD